MAVNADLANHLPDSLIGEQSVEHGFSSLYIPRDSDDGILSVQVLEFKTRLFEAVEELHIHRDSGLRFEEQIDKLVVEKQELQWEKEALQHKIDTLVNQHNESFAAQKKQFQARLRGIEEEKGKHQLYAELKEREVSSLKEELKLLQLLKYSLQKKLSELEQKLQLQVQTKHSHLSQLSEVERRFSALSQKCAAVKQAHEKLALNVEEALRLNKKLTFMNMKQEGTINTLKEDVEKVNIELIKSRMSSVSESRQEIHHHKEKEQQMQKLQHRLHVETEINKVLTKENSVIMAEKQEAINSLQEVQKLLQIQTEALCQAELELSTQREEYQALKREHKLFREMIKKKEGQIESLTEEQNVSKTKWRNEKKMLQEKIHGDQDKLKSLQEDCDHLHEKLQQLSEREEDDLMELKKNNKKLKSRNSEMYINMISETMDRPGENASLQDYEELVHPVQVSTNHPSDCDEIGIIGQAPDKSSNVSPTGPGEIESNKCSQQDYCRVIAKQACCVYTPECSDTERTGEGRCVVNHNNMLLQTLESPRTLTGLQAKGAMTGDTADALGVCDTDAVQETDSSEHKSHGCESLPANGRPDKGSPPSVNMCNKGNFSGELNGPKSEPVNGTDSDPVGEVMKDRKQKETGCIPKTVMQIIDKCDRGSQRMTGFECAGRVEAEVFEADLKEGHPMHLESSYSCALSQRHSEHPSGMSEINKSQPKNSDINPFCFTVEQNSDKQMIMQTEMPQATLPQLHNVCQIDPASDMTQFSGDSVTIDVDMVQKKTTEQEKCLWKNCDVDINTKAETSHNSTLPSLHHSHSMAEEICSPEWTLSQISTVAPSSSFELKSTDEDSHAKSEVAQKVQHAFECNEENTLCKESIPRIADTPETFNTKNILPNLNLSTSCKHQEKQICKETGYFLGQCKKRFRSSFELELTKKARRTSLLQNSQGFVISLKGNQNNHEISGSLTPSIPSFLKRKPEHQSGFQELLSPHTVSIPQKDKPVSRDSPAIKTAADMLNTSSIHLRHRRNLREEWNAIAQTFCETSAELNTQVAYVQQHTGSSSLAPSSVEISTPPANFLPRQASQSRCMKEQDVPKTGSDGFLTSSEEQQSGQFPDERDTDVSVFRG